MGFMIFFSDDLLHIYRTMLLLYPSSLFRHMLGNWLRHVDHPSHSLFLSLSFFFDRIIAFLFSLTCTLLSLKVCDPDPARYRVDLWEADDYDIR
jgi:hypothetical protein